MNYSIEQIINIYIDNKYSYPYSFDTKTIEDKDIELKEITSSEYYPEIIKVRPYPGVVRYLTLTDRDVQIEYDSADIANAYISVIVNTLVGDYLTYTKVRYKTVLTLKRMDVNTWAIISDDEESELISEPEHINDDISILETNESIAQKYVDTLDEHKNIKYMFKGQPKENPFKTDKDVYIDTYNLVYWLFKEEDIELDYPLNANYFLTNGTFYTIFGKGHKYKVDINKFEQGDIIFFGRSDDNIGIYVGNGDFISMMGQFPKDETPIAMYKLEDYWDDFNGRVMRFDEEGYDTW